MSSHVDSGGWDSAERSPPGPDVAVGTYEVDGGVVFYDTENPLAWVETTRTIWLDEHA